MWKALKEIQWHCFIPYQKQSFKGASTNEKLAGISAVFAKEDNFEEN